MQCEVEPDACLKQVLDFLVGLRAAKGGIQVGKYQFRYPQTKSPRYFAAYQIGNKGFYALPRATEFQHIQKPVICFCNGGQRATFPKGRNIPGHIDCSELTGVMLHIPYSSSVPG